MVYSFFKIPDGQNAFDDLAKNLRWFVMASELKKSNERQPCIVPFSPRKYPSIDYVISASESECSGFNYHLINSLLSADGNGIRKNEIVSVDKSINEVNFININEVGRFPLIITYKFGIVPIYFNLFWRLQLI